MNDDEGALEVAAGRWFEEGLRFKCTGCGKCCTGAAGAVYLSTVDLARLAGFFQVPIGRFARRYTRAINGRRALIDAPASHDCVFLADKTCTVYDARPTQCRTYPWWLSNIRDRETWEEAAKSCEGINHPGAPIVAASEILDTSRLDLENDASVELRTPHRRR